MHGSGNDNTASPLTGLSKSVRKEIEALFSWNPPLLVPATPIPRQSKSTSTRPLSFYDKHFAENLILKHVKPLPSLTLSLGDNIDRVLRDSGPMLPRAWAPLMTAATREFQVENEGNDVRREIGVVGFYLGNTAKFCTPMASTLALYPNAPKSKWRSLLRWSQSVRSSDYAVPDGELQFRQYKPNHDYLLNAMDSDTRKVVEQMRNDATPMATWEFKSLTTGSDDVMKAVLKLHNFKWVYCDPKACSERQKWTITAGGIAVGPDAEQTPWDLNAASTKPVVKGLRESVRIQKLTAPISSSATPSATHQKENVLAHTSGAKGEGKQKAFPTQHEEETAYSQNEESKVGKRKRDDDDDYRDPPDKAAEKIVQQIWVQAVKVDGTMVVINSGNHEIVCVRHRDSQTLFVSDIIEPSTCENPAYGKLQVGIYVAGVQDAIDRGKQKLHQGSLHDGDGGDDDDDGDDEDGDGRDNGDNRSAGGGNSKGGQQRGLGKGNRRGPTGSSGGRGHKTQRAEKSKKGAGDEESVIVKAAESRNVLYLYLRYGIFYSPIPATFFRSAPAITEDEKVSLSPQDIHSYRVDDSLTVILTSEIAHGATGVAHRGTLNVDDMDGSMPLDVVVKLAFDSEQRDAFRHEYEMYRLLRLKGVVKGIKTVLGFFDDLEGGACALVMLYAGVSLRAEQALSLSEREAALTALQSIHQIHILHEDIRHENILMGDRGITIVDFGHSRQSNNKIAKKQEYQELCRLLKLA